MSKNEFIGNYLNKKMNNHGLPYGMQYLNLRDKHEEDAIKKWNAKQRSELKKVK